MKDNIFDMLGALALVTGLAIVAWGPWKRWYIGLEKTSAARRARKWMYDIILVATTVSCVLLLKFSWIYAIAGFFIGVIALGALCSADDK